MKKRVYILFSLLSLNLLACQNSQPIQQMLENPKIMPKQTINIQTLQDYHWQLTEVSQRQQLETLINFKAKLDFSSKTVHFDVGCNRLQANFSLNQQKLHIDSPTTTLKMCHGEQAIAERLLSNLLQGNSQLTLNIKNPTQPILTQTTSDHTTLIWKGTATAKTRYQSEPETIFLSIAAKQQPCHQLTDDLCLQVQQIQYVDHQKVAVGQPFMLPENQIEGYQHQPNQANVLRIDRYVVAPKDTKGKSFAYVLSGVVETTWIDDES